MLWRTIGTFLKVRSTWVALLAADDLEKRSASPESSFSSSISTSLLSFELGNKESLMGRREVSSALTRVARLSGVQLLHAPSKSGRAGLMKSGRLIYGEHLNVAAKLRLGLVRVKPVGTIKMLIFKTCLSLKHSAFTISCYQSRPHEYDNLVNQRAE